MMTTRLGFLLGLSFAATFALAASSAWAAKGPVCARPAAGSVATPSASLYSQNGVLNVDMVYSTSIDDAGRFLYCFVTTDGAESPTLHVKPGDTLNINLKNDVTRIRPPTRPMAMAMDMSPDVCGNPNQNSTSVNIHFHGANVRPGCHSDEVIHTLVDGGKTFQYHVVFPKSEPPGLYWYHPHVHGQSETAVLGGGSGAIIVDGIEKYQPDVAGLPERVLVIRDQIVAGNPTPGGKIPSWDLSLNYVPIAYPDEIPAVIDVKPGRREFWRVVNASADSVLDLVVNYDGVEQPLEVVGLDGVPTGSQDGTGHGKPVYMKRILLPTAGRAEFIVTTPASGFKHAVFESRRVNTGPGGDNDPPRTLAMFAHGGHGDVVEALRTMPAPIAGPTPPPLFAHLDDAQVDTRRKLYFSEKPQFPGKSRAESRINFYITVDGAKPILFNSENPPAIVTHQGAVEAWTIENRTTEIHEFHMHQIHFKVQKLNGAVVPPREQQFRDTVQIPYWTGTGPYPSVTLLMDFRGHVIGDFVYHCHILEHEDGGMMAIIRVLPPGEGISRARAPTPES
jgi:FtsP/CotA-like multicopper oxidase with cupredoxin domain